MKVFRRGRGDLGRKGNKKEKRERGHDKGKFRSTRKEEKEDDGFF